MVRASAVGSPKRKLTGLPTVTSRTGSYTRPILTRVPTGFAVLDQPDLWSRPRGFPRPDRLEVALDVLRGVGSQVRAKLSRLGLNTVRDLLEHAPRRYEPAAPERRIVDLLAEEEVAIAGVVRTVGVRRPRRRLAIVSARVEDDSDSIPAVWFNQEWLAEKLTPGTQIRLRGQLKRGEFHV